MRFYPLLNGMTKLLPYFLYERHLKFLRWHHLKFVKNRFSIGLAETFPSLFLPFITGSKGVVVRYEEGHLLSVFPCSLRVVYRTSPYFKPFSGSYVGKTVIDIGAHVGAFACAAANRGARVVAFEPYPPCFELLSHNRQQNSFANMEVFNEAVGSRDGSEQFNVGNATTRGSLTGCTSDTGSRHIFVNVISLATVFARSKIETCALLKIDCEGGEHEIFRNAPFELLKRIDNIAMELHPHSTYEMWETLQLLRQAGFKTRVHPDGNSGCMDVYASRTNFVI